MKYLMPISLAITAYLITNCLAMPTVLSRKASIRQKQSTIDSRLRMTTSELKDNHARLMDEGRQKLNSLGTDKAEELIEAHRLRQHQIPVQHTFSFNNGVASNQGYQAAVAKVMSHGPNLATFHAEATRHAEAIAKHHNPTRVQHLKSEANALQFASANALTWVKERPGKDPAGTREQIHQIKSVLSTIQAGRSAQ